MDSAMHTKEAAQQIKQGSNYPLKRSLQEASMDRMTQRELSAARGDTVSDQPDPDVPEVRREMDYLAKDIEQMTYTSVALEKRLSVILRPEVKSDETSCECAANTAYGRELFNLRQRVQDNTQRMEAILRLLEI